MTLRGLEIVTDISDGDSALLTRAAQAVGSDPAAGWYVDPQDSLQRRWWDGSQWTSHVRPVVSSAAAVQVASAQVRSADARSTIRGLAADLDAGHSQGARPSPKWAQLPVSNPPATASLVAGIVSLVCNPLLVASLVAFIAGGIGLGRTGPGPLALGRARARWGIGLGVVGALLWAAAITVAVLHPEILGAFGIRMS